MSKDINFVIGSDNLTMTIFVPWFSLNTYDSFSRSISYSDYTNMSLERKMQYVIKTIKEFNNTNIKKVVFTGGDPLSDINNLKRLISAVDENKEIFITTTFPCENRFQALKLADFIDEEPKIKGINIVRGFKTFEEDELLINQPILKDKWLGFINKPINIEYVASKYTDFLSVINRYKNTADNVTINFKAKQTLINDANFISYNEEKFTILNNLENIKYLNSIYNDVRNKAFFEYKYDDGIRKNIIYDREKCKTSISLNNIIIVNDIIIKPNGEWFYDWNDESTQKDLLLKKLESEYNQAQINLTNNIDNIRNFLKKKYSNEVLNCFNDEKFVNTLKNNNIDFNKLNVLVNFISEIAIMNEKYKFEADIEDGRKISVGDTVVLNTFLKDRVNEIKSQTIGITTPTTSSAIGSNTDTLTSDFKIYSEIEFHPSRD